MFEGVDSWFDRIDEFASTRNLSLEHYVISSGTEEMIRGASCYPKFKRVFASRYMYGDDGVAKWPALAINYTTKTQYLFRINKGVENSWDNEPVNRWVPMQERPVPFSRMIFHRGWRYGYSVHEDGSARGSLRLRFTTRDDQLTGHQKIYTI